MVMIGGISIDRVHTMNNRLLVYDYIDNHFKYISCNGTYLPKCGNMSKALSLQQHSCTHMVVLAGKLKSHGK